MAVALVDVALTMTHRIVLVVVSVILMLERTVTGMVSVAEAVAGHADAPSSKKKVPRHVAVGAGPDRSATPAQVVRLFRMCLAAGVREVTVFNANASGALVAERLVKHGLGGRVVVIGQDDDDVWQVDDGHSVRFVPAWSSAE